MVPRMVFFIWFYLKIDVILIFHEGGFTYFVVPSIIRTPRARDALVRAIYVPKIFFI